MEVFDEYSQIHQDDLWVYNKLILSRKLGYTCGPSGVPVPKSDFFIVRPCMNFMGMGRFARIEYLKDTTEHLHPGEFWCEIFQGDHLSVDYYKKEPILTVRGTLTRENTLYKWEKWQKVEKTIKYPSILEELKEEYDYVNCEFIGKKLIEVHFRQNPDFRYGNTVAIPIWQDDEIPKNSKYKYMEDPDYLRKGFLID